MSTNSDSTTKPVAMQHAANVSAAREKAQARLRASLLAADPGYTTGNDEEDPPTSTPQTVCNHPADITAGGATTTAAEGNTANTPYAAATNDTGTEENPPSLNASSYYERSCNKISVLIAMAIGLNDGDGNPLFDEGQEPWSSSHVKVTDWKPSNDVLRLEIKRRYGAYSFLKHVKKEPMTKSWRRQKCLDRLLEHPISWQDNGSTDAALDVEFVTNEIARRKALMTQAVVDVEEQSAVLEGRWVRREAMLRLIHCVIDDDVIKRAFLHRFDSMERGQLENRNSDKREPSCWEMIADKWNDCEYNPTTMILTTEGQSEYTEEIDLPYSSIAQLASATPEKCKSKMDEMMIALKRIIQQWEASGQGDGSNDDEDEGDRSEHELGILTNRSAYALGSRAGFFKYKELYLLYLWDVAELHDLTRSCMQTLNANVAAGNGGKGVPLLFEDDDELSLGSMGFSNKLGGSKGSRSDSKEMAAIAANLKRFNQRSAELQKFEVMQKEKDQYHTTKERISGEIASLETEKRTYKWHLLMHNSKRQRVDESDPTSVAMQEFVDDISAKLNSKKSELEELDAKINGLLTTSLKSNRIP